MTTSGIHSSMSTIVIARLLRKAIKFPSVSRGRCYGTGLVGTSSHFRRFIKVSVDIQEALKHKAPIVALESAHLTSGDTVQGLPYPENIEYTFQVEDVIRRMGAIPATIAVVNGMIRVGVNEYAIKDLGRNMGNRKVSSRDLPYILSLERANGGCTTAAAVAIAKLVGIKVMATGGIGGVHRSNPLMMDTSADVMELGRSNVAVVCSGPRVYLDAVGTFEYLETKGVSVATFGYSDLKMLPAYYSRAGRVESPMVLRNAQEAAQMIYSSHSIGLECGQLLCNPIAYENELSLEKVEKTVRLYFKVARKKNKRKKENVKAIVHHLRAHLGDDYRAIRSERAILLDNARMGATVAIELSKLEKGTGAINQPKQFWGVRAPKVTTLDKKLLTQTWEHRVWSPTVSND